MTHVTPATAAALKAAGFHFRTPEVGDFLTRKSLDNSVLLVTGLYEGGYWIKEMPPGFGEGRTTVEAFEQFCLLLPTTDDILRAMPGISVRYDAVRKVFVCGMTGVWGEWGKAHHETLPEALALTYLNAQNPR